MKNVGINRALFVWEFAIIFASFCFFYIFYPPFDTVFLFVNYAELYIIILLFVTTFLFLQNNVKYAKNIHQDAAFRGYIIGFLIFFLILVSFGAPIFPFRRTFFLLNLLTIEIMMPAFIIFINLPSIQLTSFDSATKSEKVSN